MAEVLKAYTEEELRRAGVGKYVDSHAYGYEEKRHCYRDQGVWGIYSRLRAFYRIKATDETGYVFHEIATHIAQVQIDTYLILKARGKPIPEPAVPGEGVQASHSESEDELFNIEEFAGKEGLDPISDLTWIYNHLSVKGVKPADAPNPGVFAHLRFIQKNQDNMTDFFTKVYPRLIPAKSQIDEGNKLNDDGRTTFDLLDRILKEGEPTTH